MRQPSSRKCGSFGSLLHTISGTQKLQNQSNLLTRSSVAQSEHMRTFLG